MREEIGNQQSNWLDRLMPLACGRLVAGRKSMNWTPNVGWRRDAPAPAQQSWSAVECDFAPPTFTNGGVNLV